MSRLTAPLHILRHATKALLAAVALSVATPALAQSRPDLDGTGRRGVDKAAKEKVVREIERGVYLRANAGTTILVGPRSALLKAGTTLDFTVGQDVLDKVKASAGWEINITQSIFNAKFSSYDELPGSSIDPRFYVQGDSYMLGLTVGGGGQAYPVRRLGIGGHAGAGIAYLPLLLEKNAYQTRVVPDWGVDPGLYNSVKLMIYAGPTLEYYTKLSHFSLGIDVNFMYVLGFDYGIRASGFFKYSF